MSRMHAIETIFDGEKIVLPGELKGTPPTRVLVVVPELNQSSVRWQDVVSPIPSSQTVEEVTRTVRMLRDEWEQPPR